MKHLLHGVGRVFLLIVAGTILLLSLHDSVLCRRHQTGAPGFNHYGRCINGRLISDPELYPVLLLCRAIQLQVKHPYQKCW